MKYRILSPDGLEIGIVTDDPEFRWELAEDVPYREEIEDFLSDTDRYTMVAAGETEGTEMEPDDVTPPEEDVPASDYARLIRTVNALPKRVPVQVREAEDFSKSVLAKRLANQVSKGRRYIDDPSEAPDGVEVQVGPQGGYFYETEEAEETQRQEVADLESVISGEADVDGLNREAVKIISETLANFVNNPNVPEIETVVYDTRLDEQDVVCSMGDGRLRVSSKFNNPEELTEERRELEEGWQGPSDRPHAGTTLNETVLHEFGHHLAQQFRYEAFEDGVDTSRILAEVFDGNRKEFWRDGEDKAEAISRYAMTNVSEYQAESFVAYMNKEYDRLSDEVKAFWDKMLSDGPQGDWDYERWVQ